MNTNYYTTSELKEFVNTWIHLLAYTYEKRKKENMNQILDIVSIEEITKNIENQGTSKEIIDFYVNIFATFMKEIRQFFFLNINIDFVVDSSQSLAKLIDLLNYSFQIITQIYDNNETIPLLYKEYLFCFYLLAQKRDALLEYEQLAYKDIELEKDNKQIKEEINMYDKKSTYQSYCYFFPKEKRMTEEEFVVLWENQFKDLIPTKTQVKTFLFKLFSQANIAFQLKKDWKPEDILKFIKSFLPTFTYKIISSNRQQLYAHAFVTHLSYLCMDQKDTIDVYSIDAESFIKDINKVIRKYLKMELCKIPDKPKASMQQFAIIPSSQRQKIKQNYMFSAILI